MATREAIRDAFMTEIRDATNAVSDDDITLQGAEDIETLPQIVYNENYRKLNYNEAGASPDMEVRDSNGKVTASYWREYMEAQFLIDVRDVDEISKEPIYEDVRTAFGKYQFSQRGIEVGAHYKDFHSDCIKVRVVDSNSSDLSEEDEAIRGDQLDVRVEFYRNYTLETDVDVVAIDQINLETDLDTDSNTTGKTYTIT